MISTMSARYSAEVEPTVDSRGLLNQRGFFGPGMISKPNSKNELFNSGARKTI